ncbi:hypothetical protein CHH53_00170 [Terribacillus sp. 7520-G]|nr:hypothetical protein CHH53_00170 [Terribacillus sp. 7520-G]
MVSSVKHVKGGFPINQFDTLPKSIKKTMRYIKQDAPLHKLLFIKKLVNEAIDKRIQNEESKKGTIS